MASKADKAPEVEELKELYDLMLSEGLDILEVKNDEGRIIISRQQVMACPLMQAHGRVAHAPIVRRPMPRRSFLKPPRKPAPPQGNSVLKRPCPASSIAPTRPRGRPLPKKAMSSNPGQTLCIVEAMKVMNEIKAEKRCRIVKITAENSRPVTVEQDLFWIEPA